MNKEIIMLGSGGHATSLLDILRSHNKSISAVFSQTNNESRINFPNSDHFYNDEDICKFNPEEVLIVNGIGAVPQNETRNKVYQKFKSLRFHFLTLISNSSQLAEDVHLGEGVQILNGVIINSGSTIDYQTIVNTGVIIEHGCKIGSNCHLAPGVIVCGDVRIQDKVFIGPGAILSRGIEIGEGSIIGAGSKILKNIKPHTKVIQRI